MKKSIIILIFSLLIFFVGCNKKIYKKYVLNIIDEKGVYNIDWKDFEHIQHKDVGFGRIVSVYNLDENVNLILSGVSYNKKP